MQRLAGEQRQAFDPLSQTSLWKAVVLALLPGLITTALALALVAGLGDPALEELVIRTAIPVVASALLLGHLLVQGRRSNATYSLRGVVGNLERTPVWQLVPISAGAWAWAFLLPRIFSPDGGAPGAEAVPGGVPFGFLLLVALLNALLLPAVEEVYFRGHLLPRLSRLGAWAPALNLVLFSLYHFWAPLPADHLVRIVALLPMVYAVWWKRDIRIAVLVHCTQNSIYNLGPLLF